MSSTNRSQTPGGCSAVVIRVKNVSYVFVMKIKMRIKMKKITTRILTRFSTTSEMFPVNMMR